MIHMAHAPKGADDSNTDDLKAKIQNLETKLDTMPRSGNPTVSPVRSDAQQVIDILRSDLGAQRQMLHEVYDIVQPLATMVHTLSADLSSLRDEVNLSTLKSVFVTNARFAEVSSDLKLEVKLQAVTQAADKRRGVKVAGHNLNEVVSAMLKEPSTVGGAAFGIDSLRQEFAGKLQELNKKTTGIASMGQEFVTKMQHLSTKVNAIDNALSSSRQDLRELSSAIDIALDSALTNKVSELRQDFRGKVVELESRMNRPSNVTGLSNFVGSAGATSPVRAIAYSGTETVDVAMLNRRLDEVRAEFGHEIAALHDALEHMALKAGYVAVAASQASADENAVLLEALKTKEVQLEKRPDPRSPGVVSMLREQEPWLQPSGETTI